MTNSSEDPADWASKEAERIFHEMCVHWRKMEAKKIIAAALLQAEQRGREQERSACAAIAERKPKKNEVFSWGTGRLIAAAIRARGKE
jgi:hypothetical protein